MNDNNSMSRCVRAILHLLQTRNDEPLLPRSISALDIAADQLESACGMLLPSTTDENDNDIDLIETCAEAVASKLNQNGVDLMNENKNDDALKAFDRAISWDRTNAAIYVNRATVRNRLGDFQAAVKDCNSALERCTDLKDAYDQLYTAYSGLKNHRKATDARENARRLDPLAGLHEKHDLTSQPYVSHI